MEKLINWLKGKKSYIIAIATTVLGLLQGLGFLVLPEWTWIILVGLFGASLRAGVNKVADTVKKD